jgi:hypothetical protein
MLRSPEKPLHFMFCDKHSVCIFHLCYARYRVIILSDNYQLPVPVAHLSHYQKQPPNCTAQMRQSLIVDSCQIKYERFTCPIQATSFDFIL